ncbi:MAG: polysaccharide deacetylase family protein [Halobacteria archaeon]|nr:polysaccharide deacetylase family protein [Halobacteria archaeon]
MMLLAILAVVLLAWFSFRYAWWRPPVPYRYPRILMYHMISEPRPGARFNGLRVSPVKFERQLRWLRENGWRSFTLSELLALGDDMPEKAVVLTFDDGYADNLRNALPLLEQYDFRATLYLVVDRHDRDWSASKKAHHDSGELGREAKLTDAEVETLLASGRIELASHTLTHPNFSTLGTAEKQHELTASRQQLEERFNTPVTGFAYPFGIFDAADVELARAAGYSSAVTTEAGIDTGDVVDTLRLKRVKISGKDSLLAFILRMRGGLRGLTK